MTNWSTIPYATRLPKPIVTAHGEYRERSGFLLVVRGDGDICGLGDVAPLPGFSKERLDDARLRWEKICDDVSRWDTPQTPDELRALSSQLDDVTSGVPSLRYALELALADLAARRGGVALARWLSPDAHDDIEVNALLSSDDPEALAAQARTAVANGFGTFKIKVAVKTVGLDIKRVTAVRTAAPTANLRLDANEGWSESQVAEAFPALRNLDLEFVEQPLPVGQAALARRYSQEHGIPLALDEEIRSLADARRLIAEKLCDGIVLKPMAGGGLLGNLSLARLAQQSGVQVIFTSMWESDVGLAGVMHLACAAGPAAAPCGLSTAGMIADGLVESRLVIRNGRLSVAGVIGIGLNSVA